MMSCRAIAPLLRASAIISRVSTQAMESRVPVRRLSLICKSIMISDDSVGTWVSSLLRASKSDLQSVTACRTIGRVPVSSILVSEAAVLLGVNSSASVKAMSLPISKPSAREFVSAPKVLLTTLL